MGASAYDFRDHLPKYKKTEVAFEHPAKGKDHCALCRYFETFLPDRCEIVSGMVLDGDWCGKFQKSETARR